MVIQHVPDAISVNQHAINAIYHVPDAINAIQHVPDAIQHAINAILDVPDTINAILDAINAIHKFQVEFILTLSNLIIIKKLLITFLQDWKQHNKIWMKFK